MGSISHMPNYDVRNDSAGPYAVFYCESCSHEFHSQPDYVDTASKDLGKHTLGGSLLKVPLWCAGCTRYQTLPGMRHEGWWIKRGINRKGTNIFCHLEEAKRPTLHQTQC